MENSEDRAEKEINMEALVEPASSAKEDHKPLEGDSSEPTELLAEEESDEIKEQAAKPVQHPLASASSATIKQPVTAQQAPAPQAKPLAPVSLEAELSFMLGHQSIPFQEIKSLVEGKVIRLGGADFEASIFLQEKLIAYAQLVLVEGVPSLQITKTVSDS